MFIELVDALRCPVPHEESWLVASTGTMQHRHIMDGTLGCPVCKATYPVHHGVLDMRGEGADVAPVPAGITPDPDPERATQLAAFLGLTGANGFAVLVGEWGAHAALVSGMVELPLLLIDPPAGVQARPGISIVRAARAIPLAAGAARGIAVDLAAARDEVRAGSAVRVLAPKGRFVWPAVLPLPAGIRELARNEELVVGEREPAASPIVRLHVRRGGGPA